MAWTALKAAIAAVINTNGNKEITGAVLQSTLNTIVSNMGDNATFKGIAIPSTAPGSPDGNEFYIASQSGIYSNFDGTNNQFGKVYIFSNKTGSWIGSQLSIMNFDRTKSTENSSAISLRRKIATGMYVDKLEINAVSGYININGAISALAGAYTSDYIPCISNADYQIYARLQDAAAIVYYDINKNRLSGVAPNDGTVIRTITTPANCAFIRYCTLQISDIENCSIKYVGTTAYDEPTYIYLFNNIQTLKSDISELDTKVGDLESIVNDAQESLSLTDNAGYYISLSGAKNPLGSGHYSNPIQVQIGDKVIFNGYANSNVALISKTDIAGTTYTPVAIGLGADLTLQTATYNVTDNGYLAFSSISVLGTATKTTEIGLKTRVDGIVGYIGNETSNILSLIGNTGYYISYGGNVNPLAGGMYSEPIAVEVGDIIHYSAFANSGVAMISKTDVGGTIYIPIVIGSGSTSGMAMQTVTYVSDEDGYVAFSSLNRDIGIATKSIYDGLKKTINDLSIRLTILENTEQIDPINIVAAFDNIVCIGDSLTYSQVYTGVSANRQAKRTYPEVMANLCSNTQLTLASAGATALACWNSFGSQVIEKENALGIIYLGTNNGITDTLDVDVIGDDPNNWTANNVGSYCKFVQKMLSLGYKVLLLRIWATSGSGDSNLENTNNAITHIAERFSCAVMDVPKTAALQFHYYPDLSGYNGVHYNDLGYSWFASQLINKISQLEINQLKLIIPNA